jgi:hypothetical protein
MFLDWVFTSNKVNDEMIMLFCDDMIYSKHIDNTVPQKRAGKATILNQQRKNQI